MKQDTRSKAGMGYKGNMDVLVRAKMYLDPFYGFYLWQGWVTYLHP